MNHLVGAKCTHQNYHFSVPQLIIWQNLEDLSHTRRTDQRSLLFCNAKSEYILLWSDTPRWMGFWSAFLLGQGDGLELRIFVTIIITIDGITAMFLVVLWSSRRFWGLEPSSRLGHIGAWGRTLGREFEIFWILSDQHSILYQREQPTRYNLHVHASESK